MARVNGTIREWIGVVDTRVGRRKIVRGTPQDGVLSPFFGVIIFNEILKELQGRGFKAIAYADYVPDGKFLNTIYDLGFRVHWLKASDVPSIGASLQK